jgi:hypothetical protein
VAKSKKAASADQPKRYGTLIRVSDEFAEVIRTASSFEKLSIAEYATMHLLQVVQKRYKEAVVREAKRMEGKA